MDMYTNCDINMYIDAHGGVDRCVYVDLTDNGNVDVDVSVC